MANTSMVTLMGFGILELYFRKFKQTKTIAISAANAAAISAVGLSAPIDNGTSSIRHVTVLAKKASTLLNQDNDFSLTMVGSFVVKVVVLACLKAANFNRFWAFRTHYHSR